ncbi:unnamed protein product [Caretta caretta]
MSHEYRRVLILRYAFSEMEFIFLHALTLVEGEGYAVSHTRSRVLYRCETKSNQGRALAVVSNLVERGSCCFFIAQRRKATVTKC